MEINNRLLYIYGGASIEGDMDINKEQIITAPLEIKNKELIYRQDGTHDVKYKTGISGVITIQEGGRIFKGKDKRSCSKRWRYELMKLAEGDPEVFYEQTMNKMLHHPEDIIHFLNTFY